MPEKWIKVSGRGCRQEGACSEQMSRMLSTQQDRAWLGAGEGDAAARVREERLLLYFWLWESEKAPGRRWHLIRDGRISEGKPVGNKMPQHHAVPIRSERRLREPGRGKETCSKRLEQILSKKNKEELTLFSPEKPGTGVSW